MIKGNDNLNRIMWVDIWKGFMLLVVCLDHFCFPLNIMKFLIPIHVMSFFFLSGYLYNPKHNNSFKRFLNKKYHSLLFPYLSLSIIFLFLTPKLYDVSINMSEGQHIVLFESFSVDVTNIENSIQYFFLRLGTILDGRSTYVTGALWFVYVLFIVELLLYFICKFNKHKIIIIMISFLSAGWLFNIQNIRLAFELDIVCSAISISLFGYLLRGIISETEILNSHNSYLVFVLGILSFFPYLLGLNLNGTPHFVSNTLCHNILGYIITVFFGMYMCVCLFIFVSKFSKYLFFFTFIAQNGMIILAGHYYVDRLTRLYLPSMTTEWFFPYIELLISIPFCLFAIFITNRYAPQLVGKKKRLNNKSITKLN